VSKANYSREIFVAGISLVSSAIASAVALLEIRLLLYLRESKLIPDE